MKFAIAWRSTTPRGNPCWRWKSFRFGVDGDVVAQAMGTLGEEIRTRRDERLVLKDAARAAGVKPEAVAIVGEEP